MFSRRVLLFGAATLMASSSMQACARERPKNAAANDDNYLKLIETYVKKGRGWKRNSYEIIFISQTGRLRRYNIIFEQEVLDLPFRGKSFGLIINVESGTVEREYHFQ